jgi:hypothetical protein
LKGVVRRNKYSARQRAPAKNQQEDVTELLATLDAELLTPEFISTVANVLISRYMMLRKDELILWDEDPEGWINHEEADLWEYQVRPCAEKVFMELMARYTKNMCPLVMRLLDNVAGKAFSSYFRSVVSAAFGNPL